MLMMSWTWLGLIYSSAVVSLTTSLICVLFFAMKGPLGTGSAIIIQTFTTLFLMKQMGSWLDGGLLIFLSMLNLGVWKLLAWFITKKDVSLVARFIAGVVCPPLMSSLLTAHHLRVAFRCDGYYDLLPPISWLGWELIDVFQPFYLFLLACSALFLFQILLIKWFE